MSALTDNEVAREARRVFRKLADAKARLAQTRDGRWAVVQRGVSTSGRVKASAEMAACFRRRGWLEVAGDVLVFSARRAGRGSPANSRAPIPTAHNTGCCASG